MTKHRYRVLLRPEFSEEVSRAVILHVEALSYTDLLLCFKDGASTLEEVIAVYLLREGSEQQIRSDLAQVCQQMQLAGWCAPPREEQELIMRKMTLGMEVGLTEVRFEL